MIMCSDTTSYKITETVSGKNKFFLSRVHFLLSQHCILLLIEISTH